MDDPRRPEGGGSSPADADPSPPPMPEDLAPPSDRVPDVPPGPGPSLPPAPELATEGPLSREAAIAILDRAGELMSAGDFRDAGIHYRRVVGFNDPVVTSAALLGLGQALYRLDEDDAAVATWESILELPETPSTYRAWREVAAARVREGDLNGAIAAYRQAERRAPAEDKPEIANRLGWLAKETGNVGASRRYFAKGRGAGSALPLSWIVIGVTVVVSFMAMSAGGEFLFQALLLDKRAVAEGEWWRLLSVMLLHDPQSFLHLAFNMYALFLVGPIVEQLYGSRLFLLFYVLCGAAGSVASFVFGPGQFGVGASGAIFGLFGILAAASRTHNPVLDRRARSLVGQIGTLILINLVIGFVVPRIDNAAHIGGLVAGLWLGFLLQPGRVPTLRTMWQSPRTGGVGPPAERPSMVPAALGVAALVAVLAVGVAFGTQTWEGRGTDVRASAAVEAVVDGT
jgi:membrane associated rhomboid family serine protease